LGDFAGNLGFGSGELSTETTFSYSVLAAVTATEISNLFTEGLSSPPIFSPSEFLVDTAEATPPLDRGVKEISGRAVSEQTADLPPEQRDHRPKLFPLKEARHALETQNKEGRTKPARCPRARVVSERLAFGEDVEMEWVMELSEKAVVGRVRGKNLGLAFLKGWVTKTWLSDLSQMPCIRLLTRG
jgi:hypothetical protein